MKKTVLADMPCERNGIIIEFIHIHARKDRFRELVIWKQKGESTPEVKKLYISYFFLNLHILQ